LYASIEETKLIIFGKKYLIIPLLKAFINFALFKIEEMTFFTCHMPFNKEDRIIGLNILYRLKGCTAPKLLKEF